MTSEKHKEYMRRYMKEHRAKYRVYKKEWARMNRARRKGQILSKSQCYFNCGRSLFIIEGVDNKNKAACWKCWTELYREAILFELQAKFQRYMENNTYGYNISPKKVKLSTP